MMTIGEIMRVAPVIPVLTVDDVSRARSIAEALVAGGLRVIEVTLRTQVALDVIREMARVPGAIVGAGTVLEVSDLSESLEAGAQFVVSPGLTSELAQAAQELGVPFLPGVATASEIMLGLKLGLRHFKFFPAEASGGVAALRALAGPFSDVRFCPTGEISFASAQEWLKLDAVLCVGGSWPVPSSDTTAAEIERNARSAAALSDRSSSH
jgi:2-dehydro-3-deoxyphosphogluconate aldolase/(4S)-4-hydroxy-2-oxoglutarate aldolase